MTGKRWKAFKLLSMLLVLSAFCCAIFGEELNSGTLWTKLGIIVCVSFAYLVMFLAAENNLHSFVAEMKSQLDLTERDSLYKFPAPAAVIDNTGIIVWYNKAFSSAISPDSDAYGVNIRKIADIDITKAIESKDSIVEYDDGKYKILAITTEKSDEDNVALSDLTLLYFQDMTEYLSLSDKYKKSKTWIMYILIDSFDDIFADTKESDRSQVTGKIDRFLENFIDQNNGIIRKISNDRYLCVIEEDSLTKFENEQFKTILEKGRSITINDKSNITFSIGVGHGGSNIAESEKMAKQALDMTQGRGGDQVAIKSDREFRFYGGSSKGIEKQTKVRTRVFASNLAQLAEQASGIIIMGHAYGDLDSIGAATSLCGAFRIMGYDAHVCVDETRTLAMPIITRLRDNIDDDDIFISPKLALSVFKQDTLLVVVDTNSVNVLECKELYEKAKNVVYIDHHRQVVDSISNAVVCLHEPYASSACEIVTEVLQYLPLSQRISGYYADALLAGIMLDTKDFVNRTGVRTFEAAAYLRKLGADTVAVKRLFANSMETCRKRSLLVEKAEIHGKCAVAVWNGKHDQDVRIFSAQAADELLEVEGIEASFVLYPTKIGGNDCISISARSFGSINVQLLMEKLGGGGHQTMAASQLYDVSIDLAKSKLNAVIEEYLMTINS